MKDDSSEFRKPDSEIEIKIMKSVILVMERAVGGELFDAIVND